MQQSKHSRPLILDSTYMQDTHPKRRDQAERHWKCNGNRDTPRLLYRHTLQVSPQCERRNSNNFVCFFHHSKTEESVAFVSYLPCQPLGVPHTQYTVYVFTFIRAGRVWVLLCHACVTQTCAPLLMPLHSIRPHQLSTI